MSDLSLNHLNLTSEEKFLRAIYDWVRPKLKLKKNTGKKVYYDFGEQQGNDHKELKAEILWPDLDDFKRIIDETQPELILIAGDIFHVGQTKEDFNDLIEFFEFIDEKAIQCYIIEGNHEEDNYKEIVERLKDFDFIEDISNKSVTFNGLKILGINFAYASRIGICKRLTKMFPEKYDIVLTHAPDNRRIWFFNLKTKYIITGHSGIDLGKIGKKIYLANDYSPEHYFVIDYQSDKKHKITCYKDHKKFGVFRITENKPKWIKKMKHYNTFGNGYSYQFFEKIIRLKKKLEKSDEEEQNDLIQKIVDKGNNFGWVREYLGKHFFEDKMFFICDLCGNKYNQRTGLHWHKKVTHKNDFVKE